MKKEMESQWLTTALKNLMDYQGSIPRQLSIEDFELLLKQTEPFDFDIMLEIKDKEKSAIKAIELAIKIGECTIF